MQARYQELGGYELEARAQAILAGLGFAAGAGRRRRRHALGRLEDARRARADPARAARRCCCSTSRPTTSTSSRSSGSRSFLRDYPGTVVMTCHDRDVMNRVVKKIVEIDGGAGAHATPATTTSTSGARAIEAARREAEYERQQAMLAKEMRFVERFKAQRAPRRRRCRAASRSSRRSRRSSRRAASSRRRSTSGRRRARATTSIKVDERRARRYGARVVHDGLDCCVRRKRALGGHGRERRRQDDAAQDDGRRARARRRQRRRSARRSRWATSRSTRWSSSTGDRTVLEELQAHAPDARTRARCATSPARSASTATTSTSRSACSPAARRRALALAKILFDAPNLLVLDEPTNHLDIVTKRALVKALARLRGHDRLRLARSRVPARARDARARALAGGAARLRRQLRRVRRGDRPRGARACAS